MRPVLLGYDGSPGARAALLPAARLLGGGPALVAYVCEPPRRADDAAARRRFRDGWQIANEGATLARAAGFDAEPIVVPGVASAWEAIGWLARARDARAVVVGTRGHSCESAAGGGSVAHRALAGGTRPLLVIPPADCATAHQEEVESHAHAVAA